MTFNRENARRNLRVFAIVTGTLGFLPCAQAQRSVEADPHLEIPSEMTARVDALRPHAESLLRSRCRPQWDERTRDAMRLVGWSSPQCERAAAALAEDPEAAEYAITQATGAALRRGRVVPEPLLEFLIGFLDAPPDEEVELGTLGHGARRMAAGVALLFFAECAGRRAGLHERFLSALDRRFGFPPEGFVIDARSIRTRTRTRTAAWYRGLFETHRDVSEIADLARRAREAAEASQDFGVRLGIAMSDPWGHQEFLRQALCNPTTSRALRAYVRRARTTSILDLVDPCEGGVSCPGEPPRVCE